jgi:hypothetical protein
MPTFRRNHHAIVSAVALTFTTMLSASAPQRPPQSGLPGNSDRRQGDPCEKAVKPRGLAVGLEAQCEPLGGGGVAKGDFNGDGIGDLAVGVPFEDIGSVQDGGAVNVIYGSANGLVAEGTQKGMLVNQFLRQGTGSIPGTAEQGDHFGWALASGDFNAR